MNPLDMKPYPRHCVIESHQFHEYGICIDIINGVALVEVKSGAISRFNLMGVYSIKFIDRG